MVALATVFCSGLFAQTKINFNGVGAAGEYNLPAVSRFKGQSRDGAALSYGGIGAYVKYSPMTQFEEGFGPQFNTISFGVISGLGM